MPNNRTILMSLSAICFALIGAALYLQHYKDMLPCPLCVIQRYAFFFCGLICLAAASAKQFKLWSFFGLAGSLTGLFFAGKQLWVLAHPGRSCGIDPMQTMLNQVPTAIYLPWIFEADGLCEDAVDKLLGLTIPQWSTLWFAIISIALLVVLARRSPR
ncbi:disulfide bond formation protein B [Massilia scottii]|uniref:disulfide bond formation protein B n=1 Tax=Massilia scottii TaxID=3057166 RepID=UPI002796DA30|nr:disulfide bond formation protein B [Massilia sp. CCM 9029]MDQ1830084.1 disulfide bond formation protein B [Massilia sp. CCM 9029]